MFIWTPLVWKTLNIREHLVASCKSGSRLLGDLPRSSDAFSSSCLMRHLHACCWFKAVVTCWVGPCGLTIIAPGQGPLSDSRPFIRNGAGAAETDTAQNLPGLTQRKFTFHSSQVCVATRAVLPEARGDQVSGTLGVPDQISFHIQLSGPRRARGRSSREKWEKFKTPLPSSSSGLAPPRPGPRPRPRAPPPAPPHVRGAVLLAAPRPQLLIKEGQHRDLGGRCRSVRTLCRTQLWSSGCAWHVRLNAKPPGKQSPASGGLHSGQPGKIQSLFLCFFPPKVSSAVKRKSKCPKS